MAIELNLARSAQPVNQDEKAPAQFWMNIGYFLDRGLDTERFVSLPVGIPLDTTKPLDTSRGTNMEFRQFQQMRNELLDGVLEQARKLEPGEAMAWYIEGTDLFVQIRRVIDKEPVAPTPTDKRPNLFVIER
jgi:hypothetical protein